MELGMANAAWLMARGYAQAGVLVCAHVLKRSSILVQISYISC